MSGRPAHETTVRQWRSLSRLLLGQKPSSRYIDAGMEQQVCFSLTRAVYQTLEEGGSHSSALPMQDTEVPQPVCTGDRGGREEEKPSWSQGLQPHKAGIKPQGNERTKALILKVKYYELPASLELKPTRELISRKSLLQHLKMPV